MNVARVLFLVRRIGPYHDARFEAAGSRFDLTVVETRPGSDEYPWTTVPAARHYQTDAFAPAPVADEGLRGTGLEREVARVLDRHRPEVVACSGWADPEYHATLRACQRRGIPAIVMSDSNFEDEPRDGWREVMKGMLVRNFAAAVVAGTRSRSYLQRLRFPVAAIFEPLDVVDNRHFAGAADRASDGTVPARFLCVARFIPKKNLDGLLTAYAAYVAAAPSGAWELTLSGTGPLEAELRRQAERSGMGARVEFTGFRQYHELPAVYARAGALVLPSLSDQWGLVVNEAMAAGLPVLVSQQCGCTPDLVEESGNGWTFDAADTAGLTTLLRRMADLPPDRWQAMSRRSREIVAVYSPEAFARGLGEAVTSVMAPRAVRISPLSRAMIGLMTLH